MQSIISSEIFVITLVAGVYLAALWLYRKTKLALLHPLLVSIPALVAVMSVIGMPYESFQQGSRMINFLGDLLSWPWATCCGNRWNT